METPQEFEHEVCRIARYRWPSAEYSGNEIVGGRERDGIYITEDCVHLLECTTSRTMQKAMHDLSKLFNLYKEYRKIYPEKVIKCWFITQHEPTADQRSCKRNIKNAHEGLFTILSFSQFQSKLVDSQEYLRLRENHRFGSIYDPKTGNAVADVRYIDVGLKINGELSYQTTEYIANYCLDGHRFTLLGEYGVGKSMTLREIFRHLSKAYHRNKTHIFPIYLNLREHQGQTDPAEILERHARCIGFPNPSQLVRAWKAGYVILILDGFDEVSSQGLQSAWRRLRDVRSASMMGLKRLIEETPASCGIALAGREHFFDTEEERKKALGITDVWKDVRLDEFNETQIRALVSQFGFSGEIPSWVPSRPLLLSTLFARGFSSDTTNRLSTVQDPAAGWNLLLDEVCSREARIETSGVSGDNIRAILEALATLARCKESGIGPLSTDDILGAFSAECGFTPADESLVVLQRLPGLGRDTTASDDSRAFVDVEFADACRAGDFVRFCRNPFDASLSRKLWNTQTVIGSTGIGVSTSLLENVFLEGHLVAAIKAASRQEGLSASAIPADLMQLAMAMDFQIREPIQISKLSIERLCIDSNRTDLSNVAFIDCYFNSVEIDSNITSASCPFFQECLIQELDGRTSYSDLPKDRFQELYVERFLSSTGTTSAALDLHIPTGARVLVTILKKLFIQSMSGRKESALFRGLDAEHQAKVNPILSLLQSHALVTKIDRPGEPIWIPTRRHKARVLSVISSPSASTDPVMLAAKKL